MGVLVNQARAISVDDERITVYLSDEVYQALQEIAEKRGGISIENALKEAIGSDLFLLTEAENGSKILIKRPDRSVRELELA
jgi:hypothetical protein